MFKCHIQFARYRVRLLAIINSTLMEGKKLNLGIDMLSWDIAKAFDSVHRMIQFLVWRRMGVPQKVAELLIELYNNGTFILKRHTP